MLTRFRKVLDEMYGSRLDRVVLYGSRARGDARPDSDDDVAVFLHDMDDRDETGQAPICRRNLRPRQSGQANVLLQR